MNQKFEGLNNLNLDQPNQVEYNRRKNVQQDQRLASLEANVNQLITQVPAGYLPRVYYGLTRGGQTYRFIQNTVLNISGLTGTIGDAYGLLSTAETTEYINAIAIQKTETQLEIVIQGDYNINVSDFNLVNQRTGEVKQITLSNVLSYQDPSYLGSYDATENKGKQITVLNDIEFNDVNVTFASVDYSGDGVYNWVRIGNFINGSDGRSIYALTINTAPAVFQIARINDLVVAGEPIVYQDVALRSGDLKLIASLDPLVLEHKGNIRGAKGETGATGAPGANGQNGLTPEIIDGYWHIGNVNTGVRAEGLNGSDGTDGQSFAIQSSLYSAPANVGLSGNTTPQGQPLLTLPTLPTTGITGKGYIIYDPLTTPLSPYYDLYWANDGDSAWTIIHPFNGTNGKNGTNGYTPYIQNNNWYINGQNTGVPATGPQGPKGDKGINFMGEWVAQNEYYIDDVVTYEGSSYICILNHSGATANPSTDTTDWAIFTQGASGGSSSAWYSPSSIEDFCSYIITNNVYKIELVVSANYTPTTESLSVIFNSDGTTTTTTSSSATNRLNSGKVIFVPYYQNINGTNKQFFTLNSYNAATINKLVVSASAARLSIQPYVNYVSSTVGVLFQKPTNNISLADILNYISLADTKIYTE